MSLRFEGPAAGRLETFRCQERVELKRKGGEQRY